jgi:LPPG:FO 2-phospho-L-lactate transferase
LSPALVHHHHLDIAARPVSSQDSKGRLYARAAVPPSQRRSFLSVVLLAGGVGGAKMAEGLAANVGAELTVIVNTGDDLELHGLAIWPDHDTVAYTLAGLDDEIRGWGLRDESWAVMDRLEALGEAEWFRLGDRDLATHLWRTDRLRAGARPTEVALELRSAMGYAPTVLPMADEPVRTEVRTDDGWIEFQEYFVHRHQEPTVHEVRFRGVDAATATPEVLHAIATAGAIVIAPSNPIVSIDPILAVPGIRPVIDQARGRGIPVVAVSGIIGGKALKGPADRMLASLGEVSSAAGVAARYRGLVTHFVMDDADAELVLAVDALGIRALATDTIMTDDAARARLGDEVLRFTRSVPIG